MEPDICTSLTCTSLGSDYCMKCSHGIHNGSGIDKNGKEWRWEFNPYFGPLFVRKDGESLTNQPIAPWHRAWEPFEKWLKKHNERLNINMKILHLTLKKKWFDLIARGAKNIEYRDDKSYWRKRLLHKNGLPKHFDIVRFKNGYGKNVPTIDVEFEGISFTSPEWCTPRHGEALNGPVIAIKLGSILTKYNFD